MNTKQQLIALYTLIRRELVRMFRIASQVFLPPVITTGLYFLIFGAMIGQRIGPIDGVEYATFIAPGLIMMSVITNAYGNVSVSLFNMRFQRSIEELLVSPLNNRLILLGYVMAGVLRGIMVAILVFLVASCFVSIVPKHLFLTFLVILSVSIIFALAGFTNAIVARNFDDVMLIPTFILTPLTYLGGVFYTLSMLPSFWQKISFLNPIFYMIHALRYAMLDHQKEHVAGAFLLIALLLIAMTLLNLALLKRGTGLRE